MATLDIVSLPSTILRKKVKTVTKFDDELQKLIDDMIDTMRVANGVGLAAPQIGKDLRLAVIETLPDVDEEGDEVEESRNLYVIVNPEVTWSARKMVTGIEGCLSIPGYLGEVSRPVAIRVKGQDRFGNKVQHKLRDWDARIFQHEIDHLNGVLYIDKLTAQENFWTEDEYRTREEAVEAENEQD